MGEYFTDDAGYIFELKVKPLRACYLDRVTPVPCSITPASDIDINNFLFDRETLWERVEKFIPLCYRVAQRIGAYDVDSLVTDVGITTLIKCHRLFDDDLGNKFITYAYTALYRQYMYHLGHQDAYQRDDLEKIVYHSTCNINIDQSDLAYIQYIIDGLNTDERQLIEMYFWDNLNYTEIADKLGMCKGTVRNAILRILESCREKPYDPKA
jgi:RNA polymerase sigma factor (sigma-70 family)